MLSLLVLLAVVLLLAKCEKLLLLLLLQLRQPLAALLVQLTQLLVQGPERLLRSTAGINTHTLSTQVAISRFGSQTETVSYVANASCAVPAFDQQLVLEPYCPRCNV